MKSCSILLFSLSLTLEVFDVGGKYLLVDVSAKGSKIPPVVPRPECTQDSDCTGNSDTCVEGQCQCGTNPGVCRRTNSPFPTMCINGDCVKKPVEPEKCLVKGAICHPDDVPPYVCCKGLSCENDPLQKLFRCTEKVPPPSPKPGPKILTPKPPMVCKTDKDCKAGEICATFMGMSIGCIPADGPIIISPKKECPECCPRCDLRECSDSEICPLPEPKEPKVCPECCKWNCLLPICGNPEICPRPEGTGGPKETKVADLRPQCSKGPGEGCLFDYQCCGIYKCEGIIFRRCQLD